MPIVTCQYCGKEISRRASWLKKTRHNFCDRQCFKLYMREHPEEFVHTSHSPQFNKLMAFAKLREERLNGGR